MDSMEMTSQEARLRPIEPTRPIGRGKKFLLLITGQKPENVNVLKEDQSTEAQNHDTTEAEDEHKSELEQLTMKYNLRISKLEGERDTEKKQREVEVATIRREYEDLMRDLENESNEVKRRYEEEVADLRRIHNDNIRTLQYQWNTERAGIERVHKSTIDKIRSSHSNQIYQMQQDQKSMKDRLETEHARIVRGLRADIEAYGGALLARDINDFNMLERDIFKPMSDLDIEARFLELAHEVDTLSRLEWKPDPKAWTHQILYRLSTNQRIMKKQILQDSMWTLLYEFIFCSPFRIFGKQGQTLELQWNEQCGKDPTLDNGSYIWPKPGMETERWRYVTIKECRAALRKPVPSEWDPRANLKKEFKTSIDTLRKEIVSTIQEMAVLDKGDIQTIEKMTIKAVNIWLELEMQRCRIFVDVPGSKLKSAEEKVKRVREGSLKLVIVPALKRFGNSKGQDLDVIETVGKCVGQTVKVAMGRRDE